MVPTLDVGQRVLVNRIGTHFGDPGRGDIVVFKPPSGADTHECGIPSEPEDGHPCGAPTAKRSNSNFIKRVIGLPGDTLYVRDNRAYINGKPLNEPYINKSTGCDNLCNLPKPIKIPAGHFFMMGDNRGRATTAATGDPSQRSGSSVRRSSPTGRRTASGRSKQPRGRKLFAFDRAFDR